MTVRKRHRPSWYRAALAAGRSGFVPGNRITLLHSGAAYFPALEQACDRAVQEIYLETYIYRHDATGARIADALLRAAGRGVTVRVLLDGFGSKELDKSLLKRLREGGVRVLVYRPRISPWTLRRERLRRLHRKLVVVDREIAFVGGINILDDSEQGMPPRYDFAVAVQGPLVDRIRFAAQRLWSKVAWHHFHKGVKRRRIPPEPGFQGGTMPAALLLRDNVRHRRDIERAYLRAIEQARSEIILAHAYFLPGMDFRHALLQAARRGVRVILLLQGRVEYLLQHYATRALYGQLLDGGIEIHEYRKSYLHAKVAVIDGHWATVGSSNIDPFSLLLSREANVLVDDETFAGELRQCLQQALATDCQRILRESWQRQPFILRVFSWTCYGLLRLLLGISGYVREGDQVEQE